jgi:hypothetical protein
MSEPITPKDPFDDGFVGTGRPLNVFPTPISEADALALALEAA